MSACDYRQKSHMDQKAGELATFPFLCRKRTFSSVRHIMLIFSKILTTVVMTCLFFLVFVTTTMVGGQPRGRRLAQRQMRPDADRRQPWWPHPAARLPSRQATVGSRGARPSLSSHRLASVNSTPTVHCNLFSHVTHFRYAQLQHVSQKVPQKLSDGPFSAGHDVCEFLGVAARHTRLVPRSRRQPGGEPPLCSTVPPQKVGCTRRLPGDRRTWQPSTSTTAPSSLHRRPRRPSSKASRGAWATEASNWTHRSVSTCTPEALAGWIIRHNKCFSLLGTAFGPAFGPAVHVYRCREMYFILLETTFVSALKKIRELLVKLDRARGAHEFYLQDNP